MNLKEGQFSLELEVNGYQFPELTAHDSDANWLDIRLHLNLGSGQFEQTDPALETVDLERTAAWLSEIAANIAVFSGWQTQRISTRIVFTEPNLEFEVYNRHSGGAPVTFRVYLSHEFLPPFAAVLDQVRLDDEPGQIWIDFGVTGEQLRDLAASLLTQLSRYPTRR
jgi:hypothetical protein